LSKASVAAWRQRGRCERGEESEQRGEHWAGGGNNRNDADTHGERRERDWKGTYVVQVDRALEISHQVLLRNRGMNQHGTIRACYDLQISIV
jgi:hypothetical protein